MVRRVCRTLHAALAVVTLVFLEAADEYSERETQLMTMWVELWEDDPTVVAAGTRRMWPKPSLVGELF